MIDETNREPERTTPDPASAFPTRRSMRAAAGKSAAPAESDAQASEVEATPANVVSEVEVTPAIVAPAPAVSPISAAAPSPVTAPAPATAQSSVPVAARVAAARTKAFVAPVAGPSRWKTFRSLLIVAVAVPGLFGTVALPAYAFNSDDSVAAAPAHDTGAQSLSVPNWDRPELARDSYSATSMQELEAAAAAKAAAEAAKLAASRASAAGYTYNASDSDLSAFLATRSNTWIRPLAAGISSPYGPRGLICNSSGCSNSFHDGVDFGASCGTPIKAVSAGRVTFTGSAGAYGQRVIVDHGGGVESIYGHVGNGSFRVSVGQLVEAGTIVAGVGATGVVSGCHLDLKIRLGGNFTNPVPYMASRGVNL